jgi:hypothetical protein
MPIKVTAHDFAIHEKYAANSVAMYSSGGPASETIRPFATCSSVGGSLSNWMTP